MIDDRRTLGKPEGRDWAYLLPKREYQNVRFVIQRNSSSQSLDTDYNCSGYSCISNGCLTAMHLLAAVPASSITLSLPRQWPGRDVISYPFRDMPRYHNKYRQDH